MEILSFDPINPDRTTLNRAVKLLQGSGAIVAASDSSYALIVNPHIPQAIERLFKIKQRPPNKPLSLFFKDIEQLRRYACVDPRQEKIIKKNIPGPFTFLLTPTPYYPLIGEAVGARIIESAAIKQLLTLCDYPLTATSANVSGKSACYSLEELLKQFNNQIFQPDLILNQGDLPFRPNSAVVDLRHPKHRIIREGPMKLKT